MGYEPHEHMIAPARPKSEGWRLGTSIVLAIIGYVVLTQLYMTGLHWIFGADWFAGLARSPIAATPSTMLALLISFGALIVAVWAVLELLHNRSLRSAIGPMPQAGQQFFVTLRGSVPWFGLMIAGAWVFGDMRLNTAPLLWAALLPVALIAIFIQIAAEEIAFRGYLQSQLAALTPLSVVWMGIPSVLFGLLHFAPADAGSNAWIIALWATIFGCLAADLTARTGTLGPALAMHFANNVTAMLFAGMDGAMSGLALMVTPYSLSDTQAVRAALPLDFVSMIIIYLSARIALRR